MYQLRYQSNNSILVWKRSQKVICLSLSSKRVYNYTPVLSGGYLLDLFLEISNNSVSKGNVYQHVYFQL